MHHFYYMKKLGTGSFGEVFTVNQSHSLLCIQPAALCTPPAALCTPPAALCTQPATPSVQVRKKDSHTVYAMKVMSKQAQAQMSKRWAMYLRIECDVMTRVNHPFLVNLNYSFQTPHAAFMVLDLVSGGDLERFQRRFQAQPPTEEMLRFMCAQLVAGLCYMHRADIIHRDMKPPNVLIDDEGNLRITDFGLSMKLSPDEILYDKTGTKPYMAPELHLASKSSKRGYTYAVDWYAMGVSMWEICSGGTKLPPVTQKVLELLRAGERVHAHHFTSAKVVGLVSWSSSYSPEACAFLEALMEADPAERISTAEIQKHPFFAETNFAAVEARRVPVPWGAEAMEELASKGGVEGLDERRTAAQTLTVLNEPAMDEVKDFDFVSPRAVMEEYMGNMYALRSGGDD